LSLLEFSSFFSSLGISTAFSYIFGPV
jgi:hypothetical protein